MMGHGDEPRQPHDPREGLCERIAELESEVEQLRSDKFKPTAAEWAALRIQKEENAAMRAQVEALAGALEKIRYFLKDLFWKNPPLENNAPLQMAASTINEALAFLPAAEKRREAVRAVAGRLRDISSMSHDMNAKADADEAIALLSGTHPEIGE